MRSSGDGFSQWLEARRALRSAIMALDRLLRNPHARASSQPRSVCPVPSCAVRVAGLSKLGVAMRNRGSSVGRRCTLQLAAFTLGLILSAAANADANYIVHNLVSNQPG